MKCRFSHDGDCCNSGAAQYMCKCKMPCDYIVPITNADYIRAMNDYELSVFLAKVKAMVYRADLPVIAYSSKDMAENLEWLMQPVGGK